MLYQGLLAYSNRNTRERVSSCVSNTPFPPTVITIIRLNLNATRNVFTLHLSHTARDKV